jgi:hypothetical protein
MLARHEGDRELARGSCAEALAIYETAPDPWGERPRPRRAGLARRERGGPRNGAAAPRGEPRQGVRARSPTDIALQLNNLGIVALRQGNDEESEARHLAALTLTGRSMRRSHWPALSKGLPLSPRRVASRSSGARVAGRCGDGPSCPDQLTPHRASRGGAPPVAVPAPPRAGARTPLPDMQVKGAVARLDDVLVVARDTGRSAEPTRRAPSCVRPAPR